MSQGKDPPAGTVPEVEADCQEGEEEEPTREVAIFDIPSPPEGMALPPIPIKAVATQPVSMFTTAATVEYSPELHAELQAELDGVTDTPQEEPFPGLIPRAVPRMNLEEAAFTDLHLSATDTALFFNVDGSHSMEQILGHLDEPTGNRLLGLLFELWRAGFVQFEVPAEENQE